MNDFKSVKGKMFTQRELASFTSSRYVTFLRFCEQFMVPSETGPKYLNNKDLWLKAHEVMDMPDHPFQEYLWRINFFSTDENASFRKFFAKLLALMNSVLKFIQKNPSVVTDEMRKILEAYPKFAWALTQTAVVTTETVGEVVVQKNGTVPYEQQLVDAAIRTTNLLTRLVDSISAKDIEKLSPRDKLLAIGRLGYLFTISKNLKPNQKIYNTLNINGLGREDAEKALLAFSKKNES